MRRAIVALLALSAVLAAASLAGAKGLVLRVPIEGMIDFGLAQLVERAVKEAEDDDADALLIDINTLGGRVDAMIEIRDALVNAQVRTVAFVDPRAISAGALIAISCDSIYFVPGGTMGAATPVEGDTGEAASEKVVSYARTEFRATAERKGRPPDVAAAMVDKEIGVEGLVERGKLLTLTSEQALRVGMADGIVKTEADVLAALSLTGATVRTLSPNWAENIVRFLNHPVIAGLLMTIIFFGIIAEVQTPGFGAAGLTALIALVLFLGGRYVVGLVGLEEVLLLAAGVTLILIEIFAVPGFGVVGFLGIGCLLAAMVLALLGRAPTGGDINLALSTLALSIVVAIIGAVVLFRFVERTPMWARVRLSETQRTEQGWVAAQREPGLEGTVGVALTDLRPAGAAEFAGKRFDVVSEAAFIERGRRVRVLHHEGYRIVVQEVVEPSTGESPSTRA
jgi:membrane-bound serine protease (ClpP class)